MGKRGRNAKSETQKLDTLRPDPPKPMPGMKEAAVSVWNRIVNSMSTNFYKPHQYDLLKAYCEMAAMREELLEEIERDGFYAFSDHGTKKTNPALDALTKTTNLMTQLSTNLGLNANTSPQAGKLKRNQQTPSDVSASSSREGLMFGGKAVNE